MGLVWVVCAVLLDVNATELWPMPPHYIEPMALFGYSNTVRVRVIF